MRSAWPVHAAMMHAAAVAATMTHASAASANLRNPVVIHLARGVRSAKDLDRAGDGLLRTARGET
jgi:hypothetical protein